MLIELLARAADDDGDRPVVLSPSGAMSYGACLDRAHELAGGLHARKISRFGCAVSDVGELIALLSASSLVGSEACVYPEAVSGASLAELARRFEHGTIVADRPIEVPAEAHVVTPGELSDVAPPAQPAELAPVLILTTGTTGEMRGVRHDWRRLVAAVHHPDTEPGQRWLLAYNLNQFAGIQILLHVLASRATLVVGATRSPRDSVDAMREHGVTNVSATPTFWRLAVSRIDTETARRLPIEQITIGGEAVTATLLDSLKERFPRARISQIYGASEFGTGVSVRDGEPGLPLSVLDRPEDADVRFRIVDGELHVRSRIGMVGYHGASDEHDAWRPTGDLVEVRDGRIRFVGRSSELVNVGGVKVHPLPVEELVSRVDGVELVRAYGRANPVAGQIMAVDVVARPGTNQEQLADAIRKACDALPPAARPRRIRFVDELEVRQNKLARDRVSVE